MRCRAIALVLLEAVARVLHLQPGHPAIAADLGDDGGGGDREHAAIPLGQGMLRRGQLEQTFAKLAVHLNCRSDDTFCQIIHYLRCPLGASVDSS